MHTNVFGRNAFFKRVYLRYIRLLRKLSAILLSHRIRGRRLIVRNPLGGTKPVQHIYQLAGLPPFGLRILHIDIRGGACKAAKVAENAHLNLSSLIFTHIRGHEFRNRLAIQMSRPAFTTTMGIPFGNSGVYGGYLFFDLGFIVIRIYRIGTSFFGLYAFFNGIPGYVYNITTITF
ncbi:pB175L [African swine fever virus]|uniref:PB175L n=1 Tax=African swine fever virus TaxID=10497 RepID=A0A8A1V7G9_ASF|nr:pB175L [African swine fever virus]